MFTALFFTTLFFVSSLPTAFTLKDGATICVEGYVMDRWCIDETGGTLLDNPAVKTLEEPDKHSVHCLVDVSVCLDSGFTILTDPEADSLYTVGYELDEPSKKKVIEKAREVGECDTCSGSGTQKFGYRIGAMATVSDATVDPPVISVTSFEPVTMEDSYCEAAAPGAAKAPTGTDRSTDDSGPDDPATPDNSETPESASDASPMALQLLALLCSYAIIFNCWL